MLRLTFIHLILCTHSRLMNDILNVLEVASASKRSVDVNHLLIKWVLHCSVDIYADTLLQLRVQHQNRF